MKIILNIATHGDETIGHKVSEEIKKLKILKGELLINIANKKAFEKKVRFIDQDLNRSFPGNKSGNYEQRLAASLLPIIKSSDVVIDIHSTRSSLKDSLIVTKLDRNTLKYIKIINPKYLLYMNITKDNALISSAKVGIAFEYGKDESKETLQKTVRDIKKLLLYLNMIDGEERNEKPRTVFFEVSKSVEKPDKMKLKKEVKNFKLVKRGDIYATNNKKHLVAKNDFYPILFGESNYKDIFGFEGKKITKTLLSCVE